MKTTLSRLAKGTVIAAMSLVAMPQISAQKIEINDWKLFVDPGHSGTENRGLWGYSEAEKTLGVALAIKDYFETYTTLVDGETLKLCRYDKSTTVSLEERSDMANAWDADFFYAIHSDAAGGGNNTTVTLFGGWKENGVEIEKTPNGGKAYGDILCPNLSGVMRVETRGNWYDRCYYDRSEDHANHYPYLSVNRRTNMPSLLSEGGYHDLAVQQQRNLNADYRRLEAFAAFQSLLTYIGKEVPAQTLMTGMIYNSENNQPINGAVITVGDKNYTTDTYESLFNNYTRNADLIHNGFYLFEGLEAGAELPVTVTAEGFEPYTGTVTIKDGKAVEGAKSTDFVTFLDVALTNAMPAKVASISIEDLENVSSLRPLVMTFSRNMNRETVEQAFSINNGGEVALTWDNDYVLNVDLSKLEPWMTYTITIDGSVAKNSQTDQFFDGDGDGEQGGNYTLTFTMAEPDVEAPYVVTTYPAAEGEALFTQRPPIRLEFNEEIQFNDDKNGNCIKVVDSKGKEYAGTLSHEVINGNSVLTYYLNEDLASDVAVLVTLEGGLLDLFDNASEPYAFRFLTEYRAMTSSEMIQPLTSNEGMWAPGGSGSTSGIVNDESLALTLNVGPAADNRTSFGIYYVFDEASSGNNYLIRDHYPNGTSNYKKDYDGYLTMWVYGDGSNNSVSVALRSLPDGVKYRDPLMPLNFRGWNLFVFDLTNDAVGNISGANQTLQGDSRWCFDAIVVKHEAMPDDVDEDEWVEQDWIGTVGFNSLLFSKWDKDAERTASIEDVKFPVDGVISIGANENAPIEYFNLQGIRVENPSNGIFIRRQGTQVTKVVVK